MKRSTRPIPVYLPTPGRRSPRKPTIPPVATVVLNPTTGCFELGSLSPFPPGTNFSPTPVVARTSRATTPPKASRIATAGGKATTAQSAKPKPCSVPSQRATAPGNESTNRAQTESGVKPHSLAPTESNLVTPKPSELRVTYRPVPKDGPPSICSRASSVTPQVSLPRDVESSITSTTPSRRQMLVNPGSTAARHGNQNYPMSSACAFFTCCSLVIVVALAVSLYMFAQSKEGHELVTKAVRLFQVRETTTKSRPTESLSTEAGVRVKVEVLTRVANAVVTEVPVETAPVALSTALPCKRILCAYQTSRWALNQAVRPCDDFYAFVCGNWSQARTNDTSSFGADQHKETEVLLHTLLEGQRASHPIQGLAASLYDTCQEPVSFADSKLFAGSLLQRVGLNKWPYKDNVMSKNEMWSIHSRIFRTLGVSPLVTVARVRDPRNYSRSAISLGIPPLYAKTASDVRLPPWYLPALYRATSMFDPDFYEDVSLRVLEFVGNLAQLHVQFTERSRSSMVRSEPFYTPLVKYTFERLMAVNLDTTLLLSNPAFFKALKSLISRTKSSTVYNYLGFCVLVHVSPLLSDEFTTMARAQMAWMSERWETSWALWQRCLWFMDDMDPTLLSGVFAKYARSHMTLVNVSLVTEEMRSVFRSRLSDLQWCADDREARCLDFINSTSIKIAQLTSMQFAPSLVNLTAGFFLEEYVHFKRRQVETSLAQTPEDWKTVVSTFSSAPGFDSKNNTLYVPFVPFFDLFHNKDPDLLIKHPYLVHRVYKALLEQLRRRLFVPVAPPPSLPPHCGNHGRVKTYSERSIEEVALDATAWQLASDHFASSRWKGFALPGNQSRERSFFIFAAMGRCHNEAPTASSAQFVGPIGNENRYAVNEAFSNTKIFGGLWSCSNNTVMNPSTRCNFLKP
ncbi:hypothetical protein HPB48_017053 [Haemaphysalis longicornis]|uniref:Peptidase M13 N-terminal domain-containing protein n=1 Tax=Haemaphysalis longicornis TaxID=44386 RepID=A0A9J6H3Q4_HAELO|nr:hypothetical protein HPB48_017053 [Haemaphysalis longicornis]